MDFSQKVVVFINGNWIKLFNKFMYWEWYRDQNTKSLFIHCLLKANWKDGRFEGVNIKRGSFATSLNTLQKELGLSKQEVRTAIKHLISTQELTQEQHGKFSVITVKNYELYQQVNTLCNTELTQEQHTSNTGLTPIEEYKNNRILDNSVCNTQAKENFVCHLGCKYKTINCKDCMKKYVCPLPDDSSFKAITGKTFYEYMAEIESRKKSLAQEQEVKKKSIKDTFFELEDYDYLNDSEGEINNES